MHKYTRTHLIDNEFPKEFEDVSGFFWTACGKPIPIESKYLVASLGKEDVDCNACRASRDFRFSDRPGWKYKNKKYLKIREGWPKDA